MPEPHEVAAERLVLALDSDDLAGAVELARRLRSYFVTVKVGLELFASAGPAAIAAFCDEGFAVFADLKLHDIPNTVGHAARVIGRTGATYLTLHTAGGTAMLEAGVEALRCGAEEMGLTEPCALGVTVLTSSVQAEPAVLAERAAAAAVAGCGGVVCAVSDLAIVRAAAPGLRTVVPGIRLPGAETHDQARVATPDAAIASGADLLVCGRIVTAAEDPLAAAAGVHAAVSAALTSS